MILPDLTKTVVPRSGSGAADDARHPLSASAATVSRDWSITLRPDAKPLSEEQRRRKEASSLVRTRAGVCELCNFVAYDDFLLHVESEAHQAAAVADPRVVDDAAGPILRTLS